MEYTEDNHRENLYSIEEHKGSGFSIILEEKKGHRKYVIILNRR